jgi:hypothetical protein
MTVDTYDDGDLKTRSGLLDSSFVVLSLCQALNFCCGSFTFVAVVLEYTAHGFSFLSLLCRYTEPAENNCFETSNRPGCNNDECLNQICFAADFCCSGPYNETCVQTARRSGRSCPTPNITNSCLETSTFGGCKDTFCQDEVCSRKPTCCPNGNMVGEWSTDCVSMAREVCALYVPFCGPSSCYCW